MATKFYAVRVGRTPGVYYTWDECKSMVHGYPGAVYKSFTTLDEAESFIKSDEELTQTKESQNSYSFVDGSYNSVTCVYGYGGFLIHNGKKHIITGSGSDEEMASMRNVAGEILGCMAAVKHAIELGIKEMDVYYDYMGIEMWATGAWKRNLKGTIGYYDYMQSIKDVIKINFIKVKGHSGVEGNEEADRLAKTAVGL